MVNLKEHLIATTASESDFLHNVPTLLKFIRKADVEFISKICKAAKDILTSTRVSELNKYFCLHFVNIAVQTGVGEFVTVFERELAQVLMEFAESGLENPNPAARGKNVFKKLNPTANEETSLMFHQLLTECLEFWYAHNPTGNELFGSMYEHAIKSGVHFEETPSHALKFMSLVTDESPGVSQVPWTEGMANSQENKRLGSENLNSSSTKVNPERQKTKGTHGRGDSQFDGQNQENVQPANRLQQSDRKRSDSLKPRNLDSFWSEYLHALNDVRVYLTNHSEADEELNVHFGCFSEAVQNLLAYEDQFSEIQKRGFKEAIYIMDCYDQANDYAELRTSVLQDSHMLRASLSAPVEEKWRNDHKATEVTDKQIVEPNAKTSRSIDKRLSEGHEIIEGHGMSKATSRKESIQKARSIERVNQGINTQMQQSLKQSQTLMNGKSTTEDKETKDTQTRKISASDILRPQKTLPDFPEPKAVQATAKQSDFNTQDATRAFLEFVNAERKRMQSTITLFEAQAKNTDKELAKRAQKITELEHKLASQTAITKRLELQVKEGEEIIERFIRDAKRHFGDTFSRTSTGHEPSAFRRSQFGREEPNIRDSLPLTNGSYFPNSIGDPNRRVMIQSLKQVDYTPVDTQNNKLGVYASPSQNPSTFYNVNEPVTASQATPIVKPESKLTALNFTKIDKKPIGTPSSQSNDISYLKSTLQTNNDFLSGVNTEINAILNRNKTVSTPNTIPSTRRQSPSDLSRVSTPVGYTQPKYRLNNVQNARLSYPETNKLISEPTYVAQSNQNIYDAFAESYKREKSSVGSDGFLFAGTESRLDADTRPTGLGLPLPGASFLKDHFFGDVHASIVNGIMKYKR